MNQSYGRLVSRAAIAATAMASLLLLIKIFAWWYTGSVSILAALVDSLVDIGASLTNLLVVRYSLQPADDNHSFGHGNRGPSAMIFAPRRMQMVARKRFI